MLRGTGGFLNPDKIAQAFNLKSGEHVADFGCGAGYFTISMGKIVGPQGNVYALDIAETALESVRSKAMLAGLLNIKTIRTNLEEKNSSGFTNESMDAVLLANILFQSRQKGDIMREACRVLKPQGELVIIDWQGGKLFGPPKDLIVAQSEIKNIATKLKIKYERDFPAGNSHWGMVFVKN